MTHHHDLIRRMAAELDHYRQLVSDDRREVHPLAEEARAVLAASVTSPPDWRGLCEELVRELQNAIAVHYGEGGTHHISAADAVIAKADAALAQPEPEAGPTMQLPEQAPDEHPPSNLDRREIAAWYHGHGCGWQAARAVLARWGRPAPAPAGERQAAPVPVAVSERPWEREGWCDDEDRCWCMSSLDGPPPRWWLVRPEPLSDGWVLPAHALPLPSVEVEA